MTADNSRPGEPLTFDPLGIILAGREAVHAAAGRPGPAESVPEETLTGYLTFTVCGDEYAVAIDRVREIIRPRRITPVPRAPAVLSGILSHRGAILAVVDLARCLGREGGAAPGGGRVIVVRKGEEWCGLLVDTVGRVVILQASAEEPVPPDMPPDHGGSVSRLVRHKEAPLRVINLDKLLALDGRSA